MLGPLGSSFCWWLQTWILFQLKTLCLLWQVLYLVFSLINFFWLVVLANVCFVLLIYLFISVFPYGSRKWSFQFGQPFVINLHFLVQYRSNKMWKKWAFKTSNWVHRAVRDSERMHHAWFQLLVYLFIDPSNVQSAYLLKNAKPIVRNQGTTSCAALWEADRWASLARGRQGQNGPRPDIRDCIPLQLLQG